MGAVLKIVLVILSLLFCLSFLERVYDFGLNHNQNLKMASIHDSPRNATLLIHGPCEPLWMLSPELLDKKTGVSSYNLALSHSDFADNYLHLYFYLKFNAAPKYLLLYITPESLDKNYNTFNSYRFAPYLYDPIVKDVVKENDPDYYKWSFIPFMKYAYYSNKINFNVLQGYKHYFAGRLNAYYPDGFEPPTTRVWGNHAEEFAKLYKENVVFKWDDLREKYLLKTIDLAKQNNIKVYLYESPVLKEALGLQANRQEMIQRIKDLARKNKVPFIQFENLKIAEDVKYFVSTLNFNMEGVRLFNDTLSRFIEQRIINDSCYYKK